MLYKKKIKKKNDNKLIAAFPTTKLIGINTLRVLVTFKFKLFFFTKDI